MALCLSGYFMQILIINFSLHLFLSHSKSRSSLKNATEKYPSFLPGICRRIQFLLSQRLGLPCNERIQLSRGSREFENNIYLFIYFKQSLSLDYLRTFTKLFDVAVTVFLMYKTTTLTKAGASCREITVSIHPSYFPLKILTTSKKLKHRNPF